MNANLLDDRILGAELAGGTRAQLSLPELLTAMGEGAVQHLTGTQRHQGDPVHMFLVSLAAIALDRAGESSPAQSEHFWRQTLTELAGSAGENAWKLVVEDPTVPAFMQPPVPEADDFAAYKPKATTPDDLDVLQTAKNHDLKSARMSADNLEAWVYALVSLQTMGGFLGQGNYGVARMNGGFASRACVQSMSSEQPAARWIQDVGRMLALKPTMLPPHRPYRADGHALLWLVPWDGSGGIPLDALHPFFIEVCRLVRLNKTGDMIGALGRPAKATRVTAPKEIKGNLGDPWTPLRREDNAALTVSGRGLTTELLRDLIISQQLYQPAPLQALDPSSGPAWFHASVLVRGQGTTDGYHEARIRIEPKAKRLLLQGGPAREQLSELSEWALTRARDVRSKVLRPALFALLEGGPEGWPDTHRRELGTWIDTWLGRYDAGWGTRYFPWLWESVSETDAHARSRWLAELKEHAGAVLESALRAAPQRTGRRYRGKVRASGLFHGAFNKHFSQEMADV